MLIVRVAGSSSQFAANITIGDQCRAAGRILVVDDQQANVEVLRRLLTAEGYAVVTADSGEAAFEAMQHQAFDLVLLDVVMGGISGFEVCRRLKDDPATRLTPVVLITTLHEVEHRVAGLESNADDFLSKPFNVTELKARVRSLIRLKRYTDDLESAESVILGLAATVEARDPYTQHHCQRLADYATQLGRHLGLGREDIATLERGGFLHDIGKIAIPDDILLKEGMLSAAERELMKQHTVIGDGLCGRLRSLRAVRPIVRHHHERLDGSGYPDGLQGDQVPLLAQIIGIVDVFDALTTDRPYRGALHAEQACEVLLSEASIGWKDPQLVAEFITLVRSGEISRRGNTDD